MLERGCDESGEWVLRDGWTAETPGYPLGMDIFVNAAVRSVVDLDRWSLRVWNDKKPHRNQAWAKYQLAVVLVRRVVVLVNF